VTTAGDSRELWAFCLQEADPDLGLPEGERVRRAQLLLKERLMREAARRQAAHRGPHARPSKQPGMPGEGAPPPARPRARPNRKDG
jgi:hypothetical protein